MPNDLALLDAIQTAVLLLDGSGRIRAMNRAAECLIPRTAIDTPLWSCFPSETALHKLFDDDTFTIANVRATSIERRTIEWTFTRYDDTTIVATGIDFTTEERQRTIVDFAFSALTEHDPDGLLREACATLRQACGCDCVSVLRHVPARGFVVAATTGEQRDIVVADVETNLAGYTFRADGPVVFADLDCETRFTAPVMRQLGFVSGVATVIRGPYAPFGILLAVSKNRDAFSDRDVQLMQSIALYLEAAMARRAAEDESHRMRRDYARLIEIAQEGVIVLNKHGRVTFANAKAGTIFGRCADDLLGRHYLDGVSAEDQAMVQRHAEERRRNGKNSSYDVRLVRFDGSIVWASVAVSSVTDDRGKVTGVLAMISDISERVQAEQELLEREARVRLLVSQLPVIMWSTDRALTITSIVGAGVQAHRAAGELQLHVSDLFAQPDHNPAGALEGHALTFEVERERRNLRVHIEPLRDPSSNVVGTVGFAFDVTEQKRSERAHRELLEVVRRAALEWTETFDSISSPIVLLDDQLRVSRLNEAALELAEGDAYGDAIGRPIVELQGSRLWKDFADAARSASALGAPVAVRVTTDDDRQWDVVASPWSNAERTTIVASDVTAIARMQERLQRSERMSAVGGLVAGVAHEVRNPLFGISATLDAFEALYGDERFRTYTSALREQLDRMNELMHDLLEFGRPSPIVLVPGSIASVVVSAQSSVRALATKEGVTIRAEVPDDLPEVAMSAQRLVQVFDNLLENAIQHSTAGQIVDVRAWHDEEEHAVVVAVEDSGPGFRVEDLGRIFEPFFTLRSGGTGLGLSLVQRIVDEHNGEIVALNRESGGAAVIVRLPNRTDKTDTTDRTDR